MAKTSIIAFVLMSTLISGEDDLMAHSYVTKEAEFHYDAPLRTPIYSCQFNFQTYCLWFVNGQRINIHDEGYVWTNGNGTDTDDCSIGGISESTPFLHGDNYENKVECAAYEPVSMEVEIGDSIELQCPMMSNNVTCLWKSDGHCVDIADRYGYIRDHDSSILISGIESSDLTTWTCFYENDGLKWPKASYVLTLLNSTNQTSFEPEVTSQNQTNAAHSVEDIDFTTASPNEEHYNSSNSTETSPTENSYYNSSEITSDIADSSTIKDTESYVDQPKETHSSSLNLTEIPSPTENSNFTSSETTSNIANSSTTDDTDSHADQSNEEQFNTSNAMEASMTEDPNFNSSETTRGIANSSVTEFPTDQPNETHSSSLNETEETPTTISVTSSSITEETEANTSQPIGNQSSSVNIEEGPSIDNTNFNFPDKSDPFTTIKPTDDSNKEQETDYDSASSNSDSKNRPAEKITSSDERSAEVEADQSHESNKATVWTAFGVTCAGVLLLTSIVVYLCRRRKQQKKRSLPHHLKYEQISLKVPPEDEMDPENVTELTMMNKYSDMYDVDQSSAVIYTSVIASKRVSAVADEPDNGGDVVYSTIIHEKP